MPRSGAGSRTTGVGTLALALCLGAPLAAYAQRPPDEARRAQIARLVLQDCGSCHGMRLHGGLGPALTAAALHGKSDQALIATILLGRPGTAMPPWRPFLTESEAAWMVDQLRKETIRAP